MKKVAILVIAATNQPVYEYYIRNYWTRLIDYLKSVKPHIDVFLLCEREFDVGGFPRLRDNIIHDRNTDLGKLCDPGYHNLMVPGVLSKTILALELLRNDYDVFFRTNLSSIVKPSKFDEFVQGKKTFSYSGALVFRDSLRKMLVETACVGPEKSVGSLSELDSYKGNTFVSGSGFFLGQNDVEHLLNNFADIRFDLIDDVSIGLMFEKCETLEGFTRIINPELPLAEKLKVFEGDAACHFRLQHFPIGVAQQFWDAVAHADSWK